MCGACVRGGSLPHLQQARRDGEDLLAQLARRGEHDGAGPHGAVRREGLRRCRRSRRRAAAAAALEQQPLEDGEQEGQRLPRARLGLDEQRAAGQRARDDEALHARGAHEAEAVAHVPAHDAARGGGRGRRGVSGRGCLGCLSRRGDQLGDYARVKPEAVEAAIDSAVANNVPGVDVELRAFVGRRSAGLVRHSRALRPVFRYREGGWGRAGKRWGAQGLATGFSHRVHGLD